MKKNFLWLGHYVMTNETQIVTDNCNKDLKTKIYAKKNEKIDYKTS